jgi:hypothetical protein
MKYILKASFILGLIFSACPSILFSQTVEQSARLEALSIELREKFELEQSQAMHLADSLGLPVRKQYDDGRTIVLVKFENGIPVYKTTHNAEGAELLQTNEVLSGGETGLDLSGSGQAIGLWDAGNPLTSHNHFGGRINVEESAATDGHATHVAGTLIGNDPSEPTAKGMAPEATVDSYEFEEDQSEMSTAALNGLINSVHPYGFQVGWVKDNIVGEGWYWRGSASWAEDRNFGYYDSDNAQGFDNIAYNAPNYLIVTSAGNDRNKGPQGSDDRYEFDGSQWIQCGSTCATEHQLNGGNDGYDTLSDYAVAKNVLVVGAVDNSVLDDPQSGGMWVNSNWGPTDDGRIKPDIVAKGVEVYSSNSGSDSDYGDRTGTSFSAPMISGSAALLLEHHQRLYPGKKLLSSTLRGLISHTATDLGPTGPDYKFGWGLMNTKKAAELMQANYDNSQIHIRELTLREGQNMNFSIKASGDQPLRISIAWTDPPGTPAEEEEVIFGGQTFFQKKLNPRDLMLVNDLDMTLSDNTNTPFYPYSLSPTDPEALATTDADNQRDNIELIHVESPQPGEVFTVSISHKGSTLEGGKQDFSLIISGNSKMDYQQQIAEGSGEGWRFLSSPVPYVTYKELLNNIRTQGPIGSNNENTPPGNSSVLIYDGNFEENIDGSGYSMLPDLNSLIPTGSGVTVGIFDEDKNETLTVSGLENIGDIDVSTQLYPSSDGSKVYTLLGNPFSTTIDFDDFINRSQVGNVVYVYDHNYNDVSSFCEGLSEPNDCEDFEVENSNPGGGFRAWSSAASGVGSLTNGLIAPFQGFFVFATGSNPTLTIPESAKTSGGTFYKQQPNQTPVIQVAARINGAYTGETWLSFTESGSIENNSYDAPYLYPLDYKPFLSLQTRFDGTGYNIKNLPAKPDSDIKIPLVVEAWEPNQDEQSPGYRQLSGDVELIWPKMENIPSGWAVTLTDHHMGKIINMKTEGAYSYTTAPNKSAESSMPYAMELQKAVQKQTENTRFTVTVSPNGESIVEGRDLPVSFELHQNYPNPFNPTTVIRYELAESTDVSLDVYSLSGQRVATLVNRAQTAGTYTVPFDASRLASGIYIYQLKAGNFLSTRKMILLK